MNTEQSNSVAEARLNAEPHLDRDRRSSFRFVLGAGLVIWLSVTLPIFERGLRNLHAKGNHPGTLRCIALFLAAAIIVGLLIAVFSALWLLTAALARRLTHIAARNNRA